MFKDNPCIDKYSITTLIIFVTILSFAFWVNNIQKLPRSIIVDKNGKEIRGNYSCVMNNLYIGKKIYSDSVIILVPNTFCDNSKSKPRTISGNY